MLKFAAIPFMNLNKEHLKQAGIFLAFLAGFWIISVLFLSPALDGKVLQQGDMQQTRLMRDAAEKYKEVHGEMPNWNDRLFSGMPGSLISGIPQGSLILKSRPIEMFGLVKSPFNFLFVAMFSMFALLMASKVNRWLAAAGALGYAFMTFSISSFEAGHITKVLAMDVMPGVLAGLVLITRRKYLLGAGVLGLFFSMLVGYFHYQIAYYAGIMAGVYLLIELILALRAGETKHALVATGLSALMLGLGAMTNIGKALDTAQYSEATMRGGSAVASEVPKGGPKQQTGRTGLDIDYAFSWSYGIGESMTMLIPGYKGGSSNEKAPENEFEAERLPLYFGELQFTSGPVYIGAVFFLLFILAIVAVLNYLKNSQVAATEKTVAITFMVFALATLLISLILAWGRHFGLNEWFFNNLPYYNKFRTPMMALVIAQVVVPFFGMYGLQLLFSEKFSAADRLKIFKVAGIAAAAVMLLAAGDIMSEDFKSKADMETAKQMGAQAPEQVTQVVGVLKEARSSLVWSDWFRSLLLMAAAAGLVFFAIREKLTKNVLYIGFILLIGFDLIGVSKRYLTEDNWEEKETEFAIEPTPKEAALIRENKDNARILDMRLNPFNDNKPAPFFRNVGGYHPAKLSRYQDIISYCITPNGENMRGDWIDKNNALDMLNCSYVLARGEKGGDEIVYYRQNALGHAWFAQTVKTVSDAKTAIQTLNTMNVRNEVVVESAEKVKPSKSAYSTDSTDVIKQTYYSFDTLVYKSNTKAEALAVFSEVYYNEKNGSWKAFIDGKEATVLRVNYILRGLDIPAGSHEVKFVYTPASRSTWLAIETGTSGLLLLLVFGSLGLWIRSKNGDSNTEES
jgi:hypothetical protein